VNENPLGKITQKFENEMPITFDDQNHNDSSHVHDPDLTEAALLCTLSATESGLHTSFFVLFRMMSNTMQNIIDEFDLVLSATIFLAWWN